ncbi:MAG: protein kinase [Gemmatimonadales bacterium]
MDVSERLRAALAGRYEIERQVGAGGMSLVYLARDLKHGRAVAIKVLRPEISASLGQDRFLREIQIAAKLQHPHILPLYDSGEAEGLLYYVMPFVEGDTLRERLLRHRQLAVDDALSITRDVAEALQHAHELGVVHRDIKPENIMFSGGHAVVTDFGIARALSVAGGAQLTSSGVAIGTPGYMSPEQATAAEVIDGRTDIYSLACVLYEMLSGEPPFTGPTPQAVIARQISERPPSLQIVRPTVSGELEHALTKALAKVPADRYATAMEFAVALPRPSAAARPVGLSGLRGHGWRAAVLSVVALLAALGIVIALSVNRPAVGPPEEPALDPHRVAVLYFTDRSEGGHLSYLAAAFTEDLIDVLSQVGALAVVPPSGVWAFRGRQEPTSKIARDLRAGTLVDGSVSGAGDALRVTVRLIDAAKDVVLETRMLSAVQENVLALRDAVADSVSRFLRRRLGEEIRLQVRQAATDNAEAWDLVKRAEDLRREYENLRGAGSTGAAAAALEQVDSLLAGAASLDRGWGEPLVLRGWLALERAELIAAQAVAGDSLARGRVFSELNRAIAYAEQAVELNSRDADALELRGTATYRLWLSPASAGAGELGELLAAAERDLREAASLHSWPARSLSTLSDLVRRKGDFREAMRLAEAAYDADQFLAEARQVTFQLAQAALDVGRYSDAAQICDSGLVRFPDDRRFYPCALTVLGASQTSAPDVERAWRLADRMADLTPPDTRDLNWAAGRGQVAVVLARAGLADSALAVLEMARESTPWSDPRSAILEGYYEAVVWLKLGEPDSALVELERHLRRNPQRRSYIAQESWFGELHGDQRFRELVDTLSRRR